MLSTFVIVFRETLEAALIVAIVLAASKGIAGRARWVAAGVVAGLPARWSLALFASRLADLFEGMGTEVFNAAVLLIAVVMLGWHQIWMGAHGAELAGESRAVGMRCAKGCRPLSALAIICAVAVLREGSETVLFLYGIAIDGELGPASMLEGGVLGVAAAAVVVGCCFTAACSRAAEAYLPGDRHHPAAARRRPCRAGCRLPRPGRRACRRSATISGTPRRSCRRPTRSASCCTSSSATSPGPKASRSLAYVATLARSSWLPR